MEFYIEKLREGVSMIAAAFYPKDVIFRFSDFKSNEYANLLGGNLYEPQEENPMIGFRGASRYKDGQHSGDTGYTTTEGQRFLNPDPSNQFR